MRKITMTLAAAIFVIGSMAVANAQTQGASSLNAQAQNATIIHKAACGGVWGRWCPPGRHRVYGPYRLLVRSLLVRNFQPRIASRSNHLTHFANTFG